MSKHGDVANFENNWVKRQEKLGNWFCKAEPENQIQFAFQQHWFFIQQVIDIPAQGKVLEVGCGRGSISSFFAENGYQVSLLDISASIIKDAQKIFENNGHAEKAEFVVGDANKLPYPDNVFDVTISIGLLEHFDNVDTVIAEQIRVLKPGGVFIAYVVPKKWSIQNIFNPFNSLLKLLVTLVGRNSQKGNKAALFRTRHGSEYYEAVLRKIGQTDVHSSGVYPFPAISHSPDFPFSLMPYPFERMLVLIFRGLSYLRRRKNKHAWACSEKLGQTFFVWCRKQ